jgi:hypothetical protein
VTSLDIRIFKEDDAGGIADLFKEVYGSSYPLASLYDPEEITRMNTSGEMVSIVAISNERVVGHVAMCFTGGLGIPERGQSVVSPSMQGSGLFKKMLDFLHRTAHARGIAGLYNEAVTTHAYSQKGSYSAGARECGLQLNYIPGELDCGIGGTSPPRKAVVVYFAPLEENPVSKVYVPDHHRGIIESIYSHMGFTLDPLRPAGQQASTRTILQARETPIGAGFITILRYGDDVQGRLGASLTELTEKGASLIIVDLPMGYEALLKSVVVAEDRGFLFSGVIPRYFRNDDCLRMQYLAGSGDMNFDEIVLASDFSKGLAAYVRSLWESKSRAGGHRCS